MFSLIFVIIFSSAYGAEEFRPVEVPKLSEGEFAVFNGTKYRIFKTFESESLTLSSDCKVASGPMKCDAYQASTKTIEKTEKPLAQISPASQLCANLHGKNYIALNFKKEEYNYCQFDDSSLVNSWSLYYKYYPKNIVK